MLKLEIVFSQVLIVFRIHYNYIYHNYHYLLAALSFSHLIFKYFALCSHWDGYPDEIPERLVTAANVNSQLQEEFDFRIRE